MPMSEALENVGMLAGERLRLKQLLTKLLADVSDQATQVEQNLNLLLPEVGEGITSAQNSAELEAVLRELARLPAGAPQLEETLAAALGTAWEEERAQAQSREKALEQCVAQLVRAVRLSTVLKRQAFITDGLARARALVREGGKMPSGDCS
ncbi:MAG: hypothetical protein PWQ41_1023 [Bacillota bacterium]|nr:hypothetical protein [Bacillota bacterium]MDK2925249.1 hypothetical protein [Bacillota bacterium]